MMLHFFGRAEEEYVEVKYVATSLLKDKCAHFSGGEGVSKGLVRTSPLDKAVPLSHR